MGHFPFIAGWLVVAFLVADYPLQSNVVFQFRYKYRYGGLLHVAIHALAAYFFVWPYLNHWQVWLAVGVTIACHYPIDTVSKKNILMWLVDQSIHLALIGGAAFAVRNLEPVTLPPLLSRYYFNGVVIIYAVGYLVATFVGTIFIYFINMTFRRGFEARPILLYEKATGVIARAVAVTAVVLGFKVTAAFFLLAPVPDLLRIYQVVTLRGENDTYKGVYVSDIIISFFYATAVGVALAAVRW